MNFTTIGMTLEMTNLSMSALIQQRLNPRTYTMDQSNASTATPEQIRPLHKAAPRKTDYKRKKINYSNTPVKCERETNGSN